MSLKVDSVDIHGAGIEVVVSEEGKVNLIELMTFLAEQSMGNEKAELPEVKIAEVNLHECTSAYTDRTLAPPFTLALESVDGRVTGVSSTGAVGAKIDIEGPVQSGGMVDIEGEIDLFDPKRFADLSIDVRQADLPSVTPMSVRYIGHPIDDGKVDIKLNYEITNSDLVGSNRFVTNDLMLGDKVEGEGMVRLPFQLGVSLLTDRDGLITLEFPVEGDLDDPSFGIGNAVGSAAKEIVGEIIKSPFRLLAKLGGSSGDEDFAFVEFEAGSAELEATAIERLSSLAAGINQRPELILLVEGAWDAEADATALRLAAFEELVIERQASESSGEEASVSLALLESLYRDGGASVEQLDALRGKHTTSTKMDEGGVGEPLLDETTYYRDLRAALIEAQVVDPAKLPALGATRAEAIQRFILDERGVDPAQVRIIEAVALEKLSGDGWIRCRLDVEAGS